MPARIAVSRTLPRSSARWASGVALLALGLGGLTACGGGNSASNAAASSTSSAATSSSAASSTSASSGSAHAEALTATETNFKISLNEDHLKAGTYDIKVVNNGNATHNLTVEENGTTKATSDSIGPGESTTLTVDLDAGQYVFYCSIGTHRAMGMELTVQVT